MLPAEKAPKTYQDLLDPQWKGRMALSGSDTTPVNWVGTMVTLHGVDFVRKLGGQTIRVYNVTGRALANLVMAGRSDALADHLQFPCGAEQREGRPARLSPWPGAVTDAAVAIASKAPHPHAASCSLIISCRERRPLLYQGLGYNSARRDMPATRATLPAQKLYLSAAPTISATTRTG